MKAVKPSAPPLNSGSCLPPRKRLLVGLRRHNGCVKPLSSLSSSSQSLASSSSFSSSASSSSMSAPSISNEIVVHIHNLLHGNAMFSLSPEEMIEASKSAASAAAQIAAVAKATALEKAAAAVKAAAAARKALELVASTAEKDMKESHMKKKPKKHIPIKLLYKKHDAGRANGIDNSLVRKKRKKLVLEDTDNGEDSLEEVDHDQALRSHTHVDDGELALQIHRAMNSSPRISKKFLFTAPQTECTANSSDHPKEVSPRKKHKGPKFVSLGKVQVNCNPCEIERRSLPDGNDTIYVQNKQSTFTVENVSNSKRASHQSSNGNNGQSHQERRRQPWDEGITGYFVTDDKKHTDNLEIDSPPRASYDDSKGSVSSSNIRKTEERSPPSEFDQCNKSRVLKQEESLELEDLVLDKTIESKCYADKLKSDHCYEAIVMTASSEQQTSHDSSFIGNCKKFVFSISKGFVASKSLCSLHSNSIVSTGLSSVKVDK